MKKVSKIRLEREARIKERVAVISKWKAYEYLKTHIEFAEKDKEHNKKLIRINIESVQETHSEILRIIKHLKKYVPNVLEQNKITAIYLLITKSYFDLQSLITLTTEGFNFQTIEIARSAQESLDLAFLFIEEKSDINLRKWFKGEIIANHISRKSADRAVNSQNQLYPVEMAKKDVYDTYSEYTHTGYGAVLDLIDPFHKDLDFNRLSGYHFSVTRFDITILNLEFNLLLSLKNVLINLSEENLISDVDRLLKHYDHLKANNKELKSILEEYYS